MTATRAESRLHQREAIHRPRLQSACSWQCIGKVPTFFSSRSSHQERMKKFWMVSALTLLVARAMFSVLA